MKVILKKVKSIKWSIGKVLVILFFAFVYVLNLQPNHFLDSLIEESIGGKFLKILHDAINQSWAFGLLTIFFIGATVALVVYKNRNKNSRYLCIFIFVALIIWLIFDDYWQFATLWNISFDWIIGTVFFVALVYLLHCLYRSKVTHNDATSLNGGFTHGFCSDERSLDSLNENAYADQLVERLKNTVQNNSYSVGVLGGWGTGKTEFLKCLKERLTGEIIIDFNPWLAMSDKSLVKTFFDMLSTNLEEYYPDITHPTDSYVKTILKIHGNNYVAKVLDGIFGLSKEHKLSEIKNEISGILRNGKRNIYIFIDDIDRLEYKELFEVLRLIRNTADFSRVVYICAYDRNYVEQLMLSNNISRPGQYLEKIFNIEIVIPKSTPEEVFNKFNSAVIGMGIPERFLQFDEWRDFSQIFLQNFREANRFARSFVMAFDAMRANVTEDEFSVRDLFLIELLRYCYPESYTEIRDNIRKALNHQQNELGLYYFCISDEGSNSCLICGNNKIIKALLDKDKAIRTSFYYLNNFYRYFSYKINEFHITKSQFEEWLQMKNEDDAMEFINNWHERIKHRYSLLAQIAFRDIATYDLYQLKLIINVLFMEFAKWREKRGTVLIILKNFLENYDFKEYDSLSTIEGGIMNFLRMLDFEGKYVELTKLFTYINTDKINKPISEMIDRILVLIFEEYLNVNNPDAYDILNPNNSLRQIFNNSVSSKIVEEYDSECNDLVEIKIRTSPLFEPMLNYFKEHKSKKKVEFIYAMTTYSLKDGYGELYDEYIPEDEHFSIANRLFLNYANYVKYTEVAFE